MPRADSRSSISPHDENETPVAIKEYLPATLALRTADGPAPVVPEENLATFRYGLKCFFEEGRALATLSHPNVVRVINFFRANDTVYLVMRYERGRTLAGAYPQEDRTASRRTGSAARSRSC